MQVKELRNILRKMGFKINRQNIVSGEYGAFGRISDDNVFKMVDGRAVAISDILSDEGIEYLDQGIDSTLVFHLKNGMETVAKAGRFNSDGEGEELPERPMPKSLSEMRDVLPELYPDFTENMYYDELNECIYMNMKMFGRPELGLIRQDDSSTIIMLDHMEHRLRELGFVGNFPPEKVFLDSVGSMKHDNPRNPFRDLVESLVWDGKPRLRTWFQDTFGATVPVLDEMGMEDKYLGDVAEAWFIGGIRRMYTKCKHEIVPVLISGQGIGKGMAIKYTALKDEFAGETSADIRDPQKFLDTVRGKVVVELGESKQLRSADHDELKSFISKSEDQYRKPYARKDESFPRHFILIATSNTDTMFTDVTGNRRFFPMYLDPKRATRKFSEDRSTGQYDVEQVWAEALHLYRSKHVWYLNKECMNLAKIVQKYALSDNTGVDAINEWLDAVKPALGSKTCRKEILYNVFNVNTNTVPKDVNAAFSAWAMSSDNAWEKHGSVRIPGFNNGQTQKGYIRVHAVGERIDFETLKIVPNDVIPEEPGTMPTSPEALIRHLATIQEFRNTGDIIDTSELDKDRIDSLLDEGFIYDGGYVDGKIVYKLAYLP